MGVGALVVGTAVLFLVLFLVAELEERL